MKKKVFFVISSLRAGGAERVFWLISQYFNKTNYDVSLVVLDSRNAAFPTDIDHVNFVDLKKVKASRSFFKLCELIKKEQPYAIFTTGGQIITLVALISLICKVPVLIARATGVLDMQVRFGGLKRKFWNKFVAASYKRFDIGLCQSIEIRDSLCRNYKISHEKLRIIPNPVIITDKIKREHNCYGKRIIIVARLTAEKGHDRLLDVFAKLPSDYKLTIAGDGRLRDKLMDSIITLGLKDRVTFLGQVSDVLGALIEHDLMVLSSYTEGFPNVVIESLSVGVPVVTFKVGGISEVIMDGFNGYVIEQGDAESFKNHIVTSCNRNWDHEAIKRDICNRFGINKVVKEYEDLIG